MVELTRAHKAGGVLDPITQLKKVLRLMCHSAWVSCLGMLLCTDVAHGQPKPFVNRPAELNASPGASTPSTSVDRIAIAALGDTAVYVAWLEYSRKGWRLWGAAANFTQDGHIHWRRTLPDSLASGAITQFHLLVANNRIGLAYDIRGRIHYRPDIRLPFLVDLNPDSEYVNVFDAFRANEVVHCVALVMKWQANASETTHQLVAYRYDGKGLERQKLADVIPIRDRALVAPSLAIIQDSLRVLVGLNSGSFGSAANSAPVGSVPFAVVSRPLKGTAPWGPVRNVSAQLGLAQGSIYERVSNGTSRPISGGAVGEAAQMGSLANVPTQWAAGLVSLANDGTSLVTWGTAPDRAQITALTGP